MVAYNNLMQVVFINLHLSNSALCRSRLPLFLERLIQQFLNDTREEVATNACDTMKRILGACIDDDMLEEDRSCPEHLRPTTSALSRILALLIPMFDSPHFQSNWDLLAGVFGVVFRKMGRSAFPRLNPILLKLNELRQLDDFHYSAAAERALGAGLRAVGAKNFFTVIRFEPLELEDKQAYLYRVIKKHVSHDSLAYWNDVLMPQAIKAQQIAEREASTKNDGVAKLYELTADRLWHLAPSFCLFPHDFAEGNHFVTFAKMCTEVWRSARPNIKASTCHAMRLLADKNRWLAEVRPKMAEDDGEDEEGEEMDDDRSATTRTTAKTWKSVRTSGTFASLMGDDRGGGLDDLNAEDKAREEEDPHLFHGISLEQAERNVVLLQKYSRVILPKLCNLFEGCTGDEATFVLDTIHSCAKVSTAEVLNQCFTTLTKKILQVPPEDADEEVQAKVKGSRHVMLDIATGILASLDEAHVQILYDLLPPLLAEKADTRLQKKAYRVIAKLHECRKEFMANHLHNSFAVMGESQLQCALGSRLYRFQALLRMFRLLHETDPTQVPPAASVFVTEVLLSIPDPGARMHEAAFSLIRLWGEQMQELNGSSDPYFQLLMEGLNSASQTLQQCTIIALANVMVLHYAECSDVLWQALVGQVVGKLKLDHAPIRNAVFAFCKLALKVAVYHPPTMEAFRGNLPPFMDGMVFWLNHEKEANIRLKARVLVERAIKRFGFDTVLELTPPAKKKFVRYVEKQRAMQQRKKVEERERQKLTTEGWVKKFKEEFFEKGKKKKAAKGEAGGRANRFVMQAHSTEPEDLLDPSIVKSFFIRPVDKSEGGGMFDGPEDNFEMTLDPTGKVLVTDKDAPAVQLPGTESVLHRAAQRKAAAGGVLKKRKRGNDDEDEDHDVNPVKPKEEKCANQGFGGLKSGPKMPITQRLMDLKKHTQKKRKLTAPIVSGKQFGSKKGAGDTLRAEGHEPYAYVPISAGFLNKRQRKAAVTRFDEIAPDIRPKQTLPRAKRRAMAKHGTKQARREAL
eukprot:GGOE01022321.1.p1 GENE.GGOE01022321.1~~GGOE01022321.1.p1  ORF type:complete len:1174 (+),score=423.22 GGOE01022321.1:450-3524(+)